MTIASAGALLATSSDQPPSYLFKASSDQTAVKLDGAKRQARFLVRARVNALGPEGADSTGLARATVEGTITPNASAIANGASPFVRVRLGGQGEVSNALSALTRFRLASALSFTGNCAHPGEDPNQPCQAELQLELSLEQPSALPADGSLEIELSAEAESSADKPSGKGFDEEVPAPWTLELVEQ